MKSGKLGHYKGSYVSREDDSKLSVEDKEFMRKDIKRAFSAMRNNKLTMKILTKRGGQ